MKVPAQPNEVYAEKFVSWGDFLGIDTKQTKKSKYIVVPIFYSKKVMPLFQGDWFDSLKDVKNFFGPLNKNHIFQYDGDCYVVFGPGKWQWMTHRLSVDEGCPAHPEPFNSLYDEMKYFAPKKG